MGLYFEEHIILECDACGERIREFLAPLDADEICKVTWTKEFIAFYKSKGWKIDDEVICPECREIIKQIKSFRVEDLKRKIM